MNEHELRYRKTGRLLVILFAGWLPIMGGTLYLNIKLFPRATWVFGVVGVFYMAVMIVVGVQRLVAYYKWKY
jgi:hypothetical protein